MNPLTQRLLMSAAGKAAIPGAWNLGNIGVNEEITAIGTQAGKLTVGTSAAKTYQLENNGSWATHLDLVGIPNPGAVTQIDSFQSVGSTYNYNTTYITGNACLRREGGGIFGGTLIFNFAGGSGIWGFANSPYKVLCLRCQHYNGSDIVALGGEKGAVLTTTSNFRNNANRTLATIPGAAGEGSLGDVVEIIFKITPSYTGDSQGFWAFLRSGRYVHTLGTDSGKNPAGWAGATPRDDLKSLFQSGETILDVKLILNQFVVLTSFGRIFLSYTGLGNWEIRKDIRTGVNNHSFQDAFFDGQNYLVLSSLQPNNNRIQVFSNTLGNTSDIDDYNSFTIESASQRSLGNVIFYHNNRYYIGLPNGEYLYKDVTITPVTKPVIQPMQLTLLPNSTFNIYIDYFWYAGNRVESADVLVINEEGQSVRESVSGSNVTCTRIANAIGSDAIFYGSTKNLRKLSISSGVSGKVKVFGRRYGFQTVQQFLTTPEANTTSSQLSYITSIDKWGNADFLTLEGAFANNRNLVNVTNEVMPAFSRCHSMAGMFANCTSLNQFPKIPAALGSIITMSGMLYNCREFNQPIVNESGGILNTYRLFDVSYFLYGAAKWNNTLKLVLNGTGSPVESYTKSLSFMFYGCSALTGTFDNSITSLELITDSQYQIRCASMFENCQNFTANLAPSGNYWDTSRVTNMSRMFSGCSIFNGNITSWNVSNVLNMSEMFRSASLFNQDISNWDTSKVTNMSGMFKNAKKFNRSINYNLTTGAWNTSSVTNMASMFEGAEEFNGNISNWNTGKVTNMSAMFYKTYAFKQNISNWNTENVTDMSYMFSGSGFNSFLNSWNTGKVTNMTEMFAGNKSFSSLLSNWNVSSVTNMAGMFQFSNWFGDPNLGNWNTANVTNMSSMFEGAVNFNYSINNWNVSKVTNMYKMFSGAETFNQNLNSWNTANVTNMSRMFFNAYVFNGNISSWDVSKVTNMDYMFTSARKFNSDISSWNVSNVTTMEWMFWGAYEFNQPIGLWGTKTSRVTRMDSMFTDAAKFNQNIESWDVSSVTTMASMFAGAVKFNQPLAGWNMLKVRDTSSMFYQAQEFNQSIDGWNVSNVLTMSYMFYNAKAFNQPLSNWNTGKVVNMSYMFRDATSFNQLISTWNTSQVTDMSNMFDTATAFNNGGFLFDRYLRTDGTATGWDTSKVTNMQGMFGGSGFNTKNFNHTLDEFRLGYPSNPRSQRLTSWCVTLIPLAPTNFGFTTNAPVWGTCPALQSVPVPAPVVDFSASPLTGVAPLTVSFTGSATNFPTSYAWDFNNDGVTDNTSQNAVHVYNTAGTYSVKFTATNSGGSGVLTRSSYITVTPAIFARTISQDLQEVNLRSWAISQGWNGSDQVVITLDTGYYIWSNNTGVAALTIDGSFPRGVSFINKGFVIGCGGRGGGIPGSGQVGGIGGHAINLGTGAGITNDGYIAGGGGGGGGWGGGGGAGGGAGGDFAYTNGGAGGSIRNAGSTGNTISNRSGGGGGGRILPGTGGAQAGPGAPTSTVPGNGGGAGGSGQSFNLSFLTLIGTEGRVGGGGGGGWGASGGTGYNGQSIGGLAYGGAGGSGGSAGSNGFGGTSNGVFAGGAGGKAINLNGNIIIYSGSGIRYGATS